MINRQTGRQIKAFFQLRNKGIYTNLRKKCTVVLNSQEGIALTLIGREKEGAIIGSMRIYPTKPHYHVNLLRLQQVCETNYLRLMHLLPDLLVAEYFRLPVQHWDTADHQPTHPQEWLVVQVIARSPYTTLIELHMEADWGDLCQMPQAKVRLYHDARMAETVTCNTSRMVQPRYHYPNARMHQPDEKEQHNHFLAQWLDYALPACRTEENTQ